MTSRGGQSEPVEDLGLAQRIILTMKKNILLFCLLFSKLSFSCQCPTLPPISIDLCKNYDVIFYGKVDSVSACPSDGISSAYFTINELYKGATEQHVKVDFDCSSECLMNFSKNDEWIMYASYQRFNLMTVNICGHSRKFFNDGTQDIYQLAAQRTFEQEKQFLQTAIGIQPFIKNNELNEQQTEMRPHNDQPSAINKLWLLLISFTAVVIIYYVSRKKK